MDLVRLTPRLGFLRFPVGHVYVWADDDGLTLVDSGLPGSAGLVAEAIDELGYRKEDLRRLVLTHFHVDHVGSAADIARWGDVEVIAHTADAPIVAGEREGPPPRLLDWERPIHEAVMAGMDPDMVVLPVRVTREVEDGDVLDFADGALCVGVPGHTDGSVAIHLPEHGVLFTGDTVARVGAGGVMLGVFNLDFPQAVDSLAKMAALDVETACFGHGEPVVAGASREMRAALDFLTGTP